jgi:hypothetical protein
LFVTRCWPLPSVDLAVAVAEARERDLRPVGGPARELIRGGSAGQLDDALSVLLDRVDVEVAGAVAHERDPARVAREAGACGSCHRRYGGDGSASERNKRRMYPQRNRRVESIGRTGPACGGIAVSGGSVWLASACDQGIVTRIDMRTSRTTARIHVPGVALGVASGFGSIWVTTMPGLLLRIDPKTGQIVSRLRLNDAAWMTAGGSDLWVFDRVSRSVLRIKPAD